MISPQELELLTAHVDGELTARQRRQVARLLRHSEEAREALRRLEDDSGRLRRLPRLAAPADLSADVVAAIARQGKPPAPRLALPPRRRVWPVWSGFAAAAAVLLVVGLAAFFLNSENPAANDAGNGVAGLREREDEKPAPAPRPREVVRVPADEGPPVLPVPREVTGGPGDTPPAPEEHPGTPRPAESGSRPKVLATSDKDSFPGFERVELSLPGVFRIHELDQEDEAARLLGQLKPPANLRRPASAPRGFRVELLCRDATRGLDRLRTAFRLQKGRLVLDPAAQARAKKPLWKTDYAVFFENVTPEAVTDLLRAAARADRLAAKKPSEMRFDGSLVVRGLSATDQRELESLLHVDPVRTRPAGKAPPDGAAQPEPPPLRAIVVPLAASPPAGTRPPRSKEVERFLETRWPEQPGTIQVFLVLRNLPA
jgi:hypothetical protein